MRRSVTARLAVLLALPVSSLALALPLVLPLVLVGDVHEAEAQPPGGWLGIEMEPSKGPAGVVVRHVIRHSPAASGGLLDGDRIVKVDGTAVAAPSEVSKKVSEKGAGKSIAVQAVRSGSVVNVSVVLGTRPSPDQIFRMELVGEKLPPLPPLKLASGPGPIAYPALTGRVVLVDLFATWCGPCLQLGPYYHLFHTKYAAQGLTVLAISSEEQGILSAWAAKNGVGYSVASDPTDSLGARLVAPAIPASVLIDKHGVVRDVAVGFEMGQVKRTEQLIQVLLKEP